MKKRLSFFIAFENILDFVVTTVCQTLCCARVSCSQILTVALSARLNAAVSSSKVTVVSSKGAFINSAALASLQQTERAFGSIGAVARLAPHLTDTAVLVIYCVFGARILAMETETGKRLRSTLSKSRTNTLVAMALAVVTMLSFAGAAVPTLLPLHTPSCLLVCVWVEE